ncbi:hypothetical protein Fmac_018846 [Flemingia macrophylla]|uniref:FBD domain-containing protein n=1 Tax=Flemingia macrophylla TaxID=520843 RepID=A0ABD1M863_9FABA
MKSFKEWYGNLMVDMLRQVDGESNVSRVRGALITGFLGISLGWFKECSLVAIGWSHDLRSSRIPSKDMDSDRGRETKEKDDPHLSPISVPPSDINDFRMLSRLELGQVTGKNLLDFLRKSPFLKILLVFKVLEFDEELSSADKASFCLTSNLQVLKLGHFDGNEHELRFINFFMENAQNLKIASFRAGSLLHKDGLNSEIVKKILF